METTRTIVIEGREVSPVTGETNLYYYLDLTGRAARAEYVLVYFFRRGSVATAENEKCKGHGRLPYLLYRTQAGAWTCECEGAARGYRCYHQRVVAAAEVLAQDAARRAA